ncbi:hypothetical protein SLEP1_g17624 [Rubroshorea leprosula]|uniref:Uncharacterized protein n=1 Tax=Rubroshorea leprosula TaxID=152421 RepID=A0AAV5J0Q2_9ROSI|nr:hypothetical protein SLEP1_g17624 [Rubroshorea leprosula]
MGGKGRRRMLVGLAVAMVFGFAVYLRLWAVDYTISSNEADLLRRQFDIANREAMDESAEWRLKYDMEAEKATKCAKELEEFKESTGKLEGSTDFSQKLEMQQKENEALRKQVETLKLEMESLKLKCH